MCTIHPLMSRWCRKLAAKHRGLQRLLCGLCCLALSALSTVAVPTMGSWLISALVLDGMLGLAGLAAVHRYRAASVVVSDWLRSVCICLSLVTFGIAHCSSADPSLLPYPILPATMLLWCRGIDLPVAAYIFPSVLAVVIPAVCMPRVFVTPLPIIFIVASVLSTAIEAFWRCTSAVPPSTTQLSLTSIRRLQSMGSPKVGYLPAIVALGAEFEVDAEMGLSPCPVG